MVASRDAWSRWHPIARSIAERLVQRADPDLTDDEMVELKSEIAKLYDKRELGEAVRDVLYLAAALEHEGATQVAKRLFTLVEARPVLGAMDKIKHVLAVDRAEAVAVRAKQFTAFSHTIGQARTTTKPARGLRVRDLGIIPILP